MQVKKQTEKPGRANKSYRGHSFTCHECSTGPASVENNTCSRQPDPGGPGWDLARMRGGEMVIKPNVSLAAVRYDARVSFYNWQEGEEL